jgi:succinylglutamate desuccinylase
MLKNQKTKPHILISILTHGDEYIGFEVKKHLENLEIKTGKLEFMISNPKAAKIKKRYIDQDLNRSFPGKKNGNYEEKQANKLSPKIRKADLVIDIHSTTTELGDSIITTKLDKKTKNILNLVRPKNVLVMKISARHALISGAKIGLAFEYGKERDKKVVNKIVNDIKSILMHYGMTENIKIPAKNHKTNFYKINKSLNKEPDFKLLKSIKNFRLVKKGQIVAKNPNNQKTIKASKNFYPILFGQNNYEDIFGFIGERID